MRQIIQGETIRIFGDGKQIRNMNYVDDVVNVLLMTGAKEKCDGQVYNLGGHEPINLLNLVKLFIDIHGSASMN